MTYRYAALLPFAALAGAEPALGQEAPVDIVAAAVRQHGQECRNPTDVRPDPEHTEPDMMAWIIRCENGSFRVKFMGDRGAEVEPLAE